MSKAWKRRQQATRALVSSIANDLLTRRTVTSDQLYGLCKLTWITRDYLDDDAAYISSTKLPALRDIFGDVMPEDDLHMAATIVAKKLHQSGVAKLVRGHTGITNFRNAYRNTSRTWLEQNRKAVLDILRSARGLKNDAEGAKLAKMIEALPGIPRTKGKARSLRKASGLLTPVVFALDPRFRFPMINGNQGVLKLLKKVGATGRSLAEQHNTMVAMIGQLGIKDAGDLDLYGQNLLEMQSGSASVLRKKPVQGPSLKIKDERDVTVIARAQEATRKQLHNRMTNWFRKLYEGTYALTEGAKGAAMFDIEVQAFNRKHRLLIEVKSSSDEADVRMAIGQLLAYSYHLGRSEYDCQAIMLPGRPTDAIRGLIDHLEMGLIWIEDGMLETKTKWLEKFLENADVSKAGAFEGS